MDRARNLLHYLNMNDVPTYALYGEQIGVRQHEWLHWETIQSRSRLHGYTIAPHRHEHLFQILSLTGGSGRVFLDGAEFVLQPPVIVLVPAMTVHGYRFSDDVEGVVVTLMQRDAADRIGRVSAGVLEHAVAAPMAALDDLVVEADRFGAWHDEAMLARLTLLLVALQRSRNLPGSLGIAAARSKRHADLFRDLVEQRFREMRSIADYAVAIGISQTHLNRVSRQALGASPLAVVERRIALEARRQLMFSTLTIKQIGSGLGYDDPAYFTRFIRRVLGVSPSEFRNGRRG
ncbi:helix-turn-helix domain-containing protein [Devosia psychrophila]|nr:helix-turn-helix domain-containing protein [Devosia psychrophila]